MSGGPSLKGSVVAGFPSPAENYSEPPLDLNALLVKHPAATYFVRVVGDSMREACIQDGDLLVVDRSLDVHSGDVVIACVDGDFTVKRVRISSRVVAGDLVKEYALEAANPAYPTLVLKPGQELSLFGKVTSVIHQQK